jgi:hypothetical protein
MSTYEASVPTGARISVSHNQHIPGLYGNGLVSKNAQNSIRGTDVQRPDNDLNC